MKEHPSRAAPAGGFTLMELLIVITIILVLAGLLLPAISMLRSKQRVTTTTALMNQVVVALTSYLELHATLGDGADDQAFARDPLRYLCRDPAKSGRGAYLELRANQLLRDVSGSGAGPYVPATPADATHLADAWRDPLEFQVRHAAVAGAAARFYVDRLLLRSRAGSSDPRLADDLALAYSAADKRFRRVGISGVGADGLWITADQ